MAKQNNFPDIIFIGQPNCGKSTLFNSVAGLKAETSNFPGTTVKHTHSKVNVEGKVLNIIDLPGTYSLNPSDEAEKVALRHLFFEKPDLIINVIDASILGRSLELTMELIELGYPMIVALNMVDLAEKKGVEIDPKKLESLLGVPVIPTIASRGRGIKELLIAALKNLKERKPVSHIEWAKDVEDKVAELEKNMPDDFPMVANKRFTAIKMIESSKTFLDKMLKEINPSLKKAVDEIRGELEERHNIPAYEVIAAERHHLALKYFEESSQVKRGKRISWLERIDNIIMHPLLGYLILIGVFFGFFFIIFKIGSPLEEFLLNPLNSLRDYLSIKLGSGVFFYLADGLLQGVGGGVAIVLPFFIPLIFLMSLLEDVGYLARAGFLMDTFMHRIGLHGKSVSPFILGFGCNVPAVVSTRILESRRDKIITSLLIPFIPCSARTTIILALMAFYLGPLWAAGFYIFNILLVGVLGRIISFFFKTPSPGLILEIPSLKVPSLKSLFRKTYFQLKSFLIFAWPILIVGSIVLALMQFFRLDSFINLVLSPFVEKALGLPRELGVTLVFGFLRKELSLIMMLQALDVSYQDLMTLITRQQLIIFTVFISFFIPCVSTVAILWKEIGKKMALLSIALNTGVAIIISLLVRMIIGI
ncbi:MAG: ferrous iron transport protein B [Candidatus Aminicenantes bacterium]|nr:MAG: ferrous iron transport protein B [Candidatus Aminicenantes bacterium]